MVSNTVIKRVEAFILLESWQVEPGDPGPVASFVAIASESTTKGSECFKLALSSTGAHNQFF